SAVRGAKLQAKQLRASRRAQAKQALNASPSIRTAQTPHRKSVRRTIASNLMSLGAMAGVGLMFVATSVPANAFYEESVTDAPLAAVAEVQALSVADNTITSSVARDSYGAI